MGYSITTKYLGGISSSSIRRRISRLAFCIRITIFWAFIATLFVGVAAPILINLFFPHNSTESGRLAVQLSAGVCFLIISVVTSGYLVMIGQQFVYALANLSGTVFSAIALWFLKVTNKPEVAFLAIDLGMLLTCSILLKSTSLSFSESVPRFKEIRVYLNLFFGKHVAKET